MQKLFRVFMPLWINTMPGISCLRRPLTVAKVLLTLLFHSFHVESMDAEEFLHAFLNITSLQKKWHPDVVNFFTSPLKCVFEMSNRELVNMCNNSKKQALFCAVGEVDVIVMPARS
jgi:hypothetical protein